MGYQDSLVGLYDLSTDNNPNLAPHFAGTYDAIGANIASHPIGIHGKSQCASFNGNNSNYNLGDVAELNAVAAFTIAFWMRQDVLDVQDTIFRKAVDNNHDVGIETRANGNLYVDVGWNADEAGYIPNYSTVITAGQWHHFAAVFDGAQTGDANRLVMYVDGNPVTLSFNGSMPAATADLSGQDAIIGAAASAFDGLLDFFSVFSRPLTQIQTQDFRKMTMQGRL